MKVASAGWSQVVEVRMDTGDVWYRFGAPTRWYLMSSDDSLILVDSVAERLEDAYTEWLRNN